MPFAHVVDSRMPPVRASTHGTHAPTCMPASPDQQHAHALLQTAWGISQGCALCLSSRGCRIKAFTIWDGRAYNHFTACEHGYCALAAMHMCKHQSARAPPLRLCALLHAGRCCGSQGRVYCLLSRCRAAGGRAAPALVARLVRGPVRPRSRTEHAGRNAAEDAAHAHCPNSKAFRLFRSQ